MYFFGLGSNLGFKLTIYGNSCVNVVFGEIKGISALASRLTRLQVNWGIVRTNIYKIV